MTSRRPLAHWSLASLLFSSCVVGNLDVVHKSGEPQAGSSNGEGGEGASPYGGEGGSATSGDGGSSAHAGLMMGAGGKTTSGDGGQAVAGSPEMPGASGETNQGGDGSIDPTQKCGDYHEVADTTSSTSASYAGNKFKEGLLFCASITSGHYDAVNKVVDTDSVLFDVLEEGDYRATLVLESPDPTATVKFTFGAESWTALTHGVGLAHLSKGMTMGGYSVKALNPKAIAESVPYKVRIHKDDLASHCPNATVTTGTYAEKNDGASFNGNDVLRYDYKKDVQTPTANADDAPEATGLVVENGKRVAISGSSADAHYGQTYADADMFSFETGDTTQLSARLKWTGTTRLAVLFFNENGYQRIAYAPRSYQDDPAVFAVRPNTKYWVYVSAEENLAVLPQSYELGLCGETFNE